MSYAGYTAKSIGNLSLFSGITYRYTWNVSQSSWVKPNYSSGAYYFPSVIIDGTNSAGTGGAQRLLYLTYCDLNAYKINGSSFYYRSPTDHGFKGVGADTSSASHNTPGTYNCLAYSVGIADHWEDPWGVKPTIAQLDAYMTAKGYGTASATVMLDTRIVSYNNGAHLAKVVKWSTTDKMPPQIMSKRGSYVAY